VEKDGTYSIDYLPVEREMILWAFQDGNGNGRFERGREYGALYPDTLRPTASRPRWDEVDLYIVDPNEPAQVRGTVRNATGLDTFAVGVALFAPGDTLRGSYFTLCSSRGSFAFPKVHAGTYALKAFLEIRPDSLCGTYPCFDDTTRLCVEPCLQLPDSLRLEPGDERDVGELVLERREER